MEEKHTINWHIMARKWEYPIEAIREAITDAICHRDYKIASNVQIKVAVFNEYGYYEFNRWLSIYERNLPYTTNFVKITVKFITYILT